MQTLHLDERIASTAAMIAVDTQRHWSML